MEDVHTGEEKQKKYGDKEIDENFISIRDPIQKVGLNKIESL